MQFLFTVTKRFLVELFVRNAAVLYLKVKYFVSTVDTEFIMILLKETHVQGKKMRSHVTI